jgi:hypothetical protein
VLCPSRPVGVDHATMLAGSVKHSFVVVVVLCCVVAVVVVGVVAVAVVGGGVMRVPVWLNEPADG